MNLVYKKGLNAAHWKLIGAQLGVSSSTIDEIERASHPFPRDCLRKLIDEWKRRDGSVTLDMFKIALSVLERSCDTTCALIVFALIIGIASGYCYRLRYPVESRPKPVIEYIENVRSLYKNSIQPDVPGIVFLLYAKDSVEFISPVLYKFTGQASQQQNRTEVHFDSLFTFTGSGQRILIQGDPGSGKTTLSIKLTKEWASKMKNSKIAKCPVVLRVPMEKFHPEEQNISLLNILSINGTIKTVKKEVVEYFSEQINEVNLCIIFDGLDQNIPAYNDSNNYIYKIITGEQLPTATVIVLSRPEGYKEFFEISGTSGFQAYDLFGFNSNSITEYVTKNIPNDTLAEKFLNFLHDQPDIEQLCTSPLHLTIFVVSVNHSSEAGFPSTLSEAYTKSLSYALKQEMMRRNSSDKGCRKITLTNFYSIRECNQDLADAITSVSRLAFHNLAIFDLNADNTIRSKSVRTQFSALELSSYLPSHDRFGLLSSSKSL